MTATTGPRVNLREGENAVVVATSYGIAAGVTVNNGALMVLSGGYVQPATAATGLEPVGVADVPDGQVISTGAGSFQIACRAGTFGPFASGTGIDAITAANAGQQCYFIDDQTVGLTDGLGTRSWAGRIIGVQAYSQNPYTEAGVLIQVGARAAAAPVARCVISTPVTLSLLANGGIIDAGPIPFAGRLLAMQFRTTTAATTAAKAATLTAQTKVGASAAVPVTGGVLALTSANQTPIWAVTQASAITALGVFAAGTNVQALISAVTAFAEGAGVLDFIIG